MQRLMQNDALKFAIYIFGTHFGQLTQTVQKKRQMQYYASMNLVSGELVADYIL